ncbi:PTS fructose transporter subunit IIABC [Brevibacillus halotolerans]|uniref:PTS fructose transporter subunit IIABC n=1 Tax=Brevibacillus halotolerans TaxID=1507437 RepID=UPI0015EE7100|nr:PTS fructose transporter subunit IIABC [Brevibacillus halotolerans]MBA4531567.1 PTS sugar transporter subunit IIA [Brevibacillus halotolerans]
MRILDMLRADTIVMQLSATSKAEVIQELIDQLDQADCLNDKDGMREAILAREAHASTGIGEGIAIPHAKTEAVKKPSIAFGYSREGIDYDALDGQKSHLFFMIAATADANQAHLETLAHLSEMLMDESFRNELILATSKEELLKMIARKEKESHNVEEPSVLPGETGRVKVVAVTACPTGIAHTYMAADALKKKAEEMGIAIRVETNGSGGAKNKLTSEEIEQADAVIVAADKQVEMDRFKGKVVIEVPVADGIRKAEDLITRAVNQDGPVYQGSTSTSSADSSEDKSGRSGFYKHLMSGVSNMLPLVVGGGIIIAISFMFGINAAKPDDPTFNPIAKLLSDIGGGSAFKLMIPVLAGYIAMSIADRPGLAPGLVGGWLAAETGSGFLGGLIAGFLAGYLVVGLKKAFSGLPQSLEGIKPTLLYPLFGILLTGLVILGVISQPVAALNNWLTDWLSNMGQGNAVILGIVVGAMMAVDMGGPVNKAAFTFGIAMIAAGNYGPHAAIMAAGMTPPLGIALATTLFKKKFTAQEREAGKTAYILGASFITEGAIPFAAADPTRIIPATVLGSAVAGGLSMFFGCTLPAPHGGMFVLPVVGNVGMYIVSILVGTLITALMINILKKEVHE